MNANQQIAARLALLRRGNVWWVTGGGDELEEMGPYRTRAEANEDRRGVQRYLRNCNRRNFVTVTH